MGGSSESETVIPTISLVALPCGDAETVPDGTQPHQNASSEASFCYSHSFTLVCRYVIPAYSSWAVDYRRFTVESRRVTSRGCLGQILRQARKLFRNLEPAFLFLSRGQKRSGCEARNRPK